MTVRECVRVESRHTILRGQGMVCSGVVPGSAERERGDLHVTFNVLWPKKLTYIQREQLRTFGVHV